MHRQESVPVFIRPMTTADLPLCNHLVDQAGWNQLDRDWLRALELEPDGCFVAEVNGVAVATTTSCCFGNIGWIAMVLVDHQMRGQGIAKRLLEHAIVFLERRGMITIRLDATALGQGLYQKLGFKDEYEVIRFAGMLHTEQKPQENSQPLKDSTLVSQLDFEVTSTDRGKFIQNLIDKASKPFYFQVENGKSVGYAGYREGRNAIQIGPVIAVNEASGIQLLDAIASHFPKKKVYIDVPVQNEAAIGWARSTGFTEQRRFARMYRGEAVQDFPKMIWASSGPEKG